MNQATPPIRVAIVEDQAEDREVLLDLLRDSTEVECVAACHSATEAVEVLPQRQPEIVLMDIGLPGLSGIDCVRRLGLLLPKAQFMMLTVFEDHDRIFRSLAAGATGYLLKKTPPPKLIEAILELHGGGAPMSGQVARQVVAAFRQPIDPTEVLSDVERRVLEQLALGLLYKEVADVLKISPGTVRTHVWRIYRKLHAHNRTEALRNTPPASRK